MCDYINLKKKFFLGKKGSTSFQVLKKGITKKGQGNQKGAGHRTLQKWPRQNTPFAYTYLSTVLYASSSVAVMKAGGGDSGSGL